MVLILLVSLLPIPTEATNIRDIEFPVSGQVTHRNDYGEPRSGGRSHEGNDLMGEKMMPLLAAVDGWVSYITIPEASWGYGLVLRDADGWEYWYLHINNDTPGTDDGNGGLENAFAPGIRCGSRVTRGQHVAYMGDSGNAEAAGPHLHFEIHRPDGSTIDPYWSLLNARRSSAFDPAAELQLARSINDDRDLPDVRLRYCLSDSLITTPETDAVYYCGADGRRYVFPNRRIYDSWYDDFDSVITITATELAAVPIGGAVTYRPGERLVKLTTDPKVYAVSRGGVLRWVTTPEIAASMYGDDWARQVDDLPDAYFASYTIGDPITVAL
ncbi:hypothetical protein AMJ57_01425 [Parcubacteria bacterium SG8_24]|nr:MAG: hypothetical protein AMJ57_01425 [Parcubacteria bacterium SG8_24]